jgi:hypothetical protein
MAQLSSPGVSVSVIDESFYTPAAAGTVPLIIVASAENKQNSSSTGTALGTTAAKAGEVYLLTSQKDLGDTFGTPIFKTDANNNPVHAGEQNEYGLQAAYSFLGVSNRAYVVRANIDLAQLDPLADAPTSNPDNGTYWLDTVSSYFGIFEWNATTQSFANRVPVVITDTTKIADMGQTYPAPRASIGLPGDYAVVAVTTDITFWRKAAAGTWSIVGTTAWNDAWTGDVLTKISPHTDVPQWKTADLNAPTGSVWIKTTTPNLGANWVLKKFNSDTIAWEEQNTPLYADGKSALAALDKTGGGTNLAIGAAYVQYNTLGSGISQGYFKLFARASVGPTILEQSTALTGTGSATFVIRESIKGSTAWNTTTTITFALNASAVTTGTNFAAAINLAGLVNVTAEANGTTGLVTITHALGGDFDIVSMTGTGFDATLFGGVGLVVNATQWSAGGDTGFAIPSSMAPTNIAMDGQLWYNSIVDEVDIMVHNGRTWVGYQFQGDGVTTFNSPYFNASASQKTDPNGPQVTATKPKTQSDGTALVNGDLWIDTSDLENYPRIYRYNLSTQKWILVNSSDQTTDEGIVFRDARWKIEPSTEAGSINGNPATIQQLLTSDFLDFDAPDPALYPKGMLLWNLRRSGFNVKKFVYNYIDTNGAGNDRYNDEGMNTYYPNRWISVAANQEDGSGTFGHNAQRRVIIQALQALVNSNQQIRDEESRIFNLMACPGYPELIGEMISLNYDRGLTAFVVGDTPARLTPDATSLSNWGNNVQGALEDNDKGAVSFDEYLGCFYPWGYTSDNIGNNVVVPPSHMMLRTIALSDQVSYPWFAPAGTRRGGITNATAVGYITTEGEFQSVALNTGQRDTLAGVKVNPLTFITGTGLVNYGQYTRAKNASALDRINVARLVIYLRRQFAQLAKPYVFEPNDKITRDEIKGAAESLLLELVGQRALYDYIVVCDTSNNTPSRIDRSELYLDVAIEPVKAVEFIYIPLRLKNTGEIKALG